jgi:hypothetical protein
MVGVHVADHDRAQPVVVDVAPQIRERARTQVEHDRQFAVVDEVRAAGAIRPRDR